VIVSDGGGSGQGFFGRLFARREDVAVYPANAPDYGGPPSDAYLYRPGELLVLDEPGQLDQFYARAAELGLSYCRCEQLTPDRDGGRLGSDERPAGPSGPQGTVARFFIGSRSSLEDILRHFGQHAEGSLAATPNHGVLRMANWETVELVKPRLPSSPSVAPVLRGGGIGVTVAVVDTGLPRGYEHNVLLSTVMTLPADQEPWDYSGPGPLLAYPHGHGSFVAGVVRQVASEATVWSFRGLDDDGVTDEWQLGRKLVQVRSVNPDIILLSLGAITRADQPLMGLNALAAVASQNGPTSRRGAPIVVAAGGNFGDRRPVYPAAEPWAISVGAVELVDGAPRRASFSNYGPWVDVCALGVDVLSSFPAKPYQADPNSEVINFQGYALWSGTSVAAAHVSGVIAELLARRPGLSRQDVLAALAQRHGAVLVPDLGTYIA
jgi:hypothetical protein